MRMTFVLASCMMLTAIIPASAQGTGPVATQCSRDIQSFCADKGHGAGQTRSCLEANREKVSSECRQALDTTGPGRGKGRK